jgi:uncharacterized membrane protein
MPPAFKALLFGAATLFIIWRILVDLATGVARDRHGNRYDINQKPLSYLMVMMAMAVFVAFGTTQVLSAFGLASDPVPGLQNVLSAFLLHSNHT